jgi:Kef-type K+ transport system membrane component KefB/mannitol/fructose-specific phosphotransferase system IIA component
MNLDTFEITIFLFSIGVMLFAARSLGELLRLVKQPIVIGEILAGIILGPTIFGLLLPEQYNFLFNSSKNIEIALDGITTLAVVMLLLVSGIEVDLSVTIKQGKAALYTSIMGILFPFTVGFGMAYYFPDLLGIKHESMRLVFALFVGTALSITALPVVARTLMDLNIFKTEIGFLIIASAMLNDLVGWIIFSIILGMVGSAVHGFGFGTTVALTFLFIFFTLVIGRKIINFILPYIQRKITFPGGVLNFILITGLLSAAFTEFIGVHAIFGAFIIGIAIGDSAHLQENTRDIIQQFVTNIFAPLFFVSIGLRINFIQHFDFSIVLIFLVLAFLGKVVGCGLGAYWGGLDKDKALAVGFGMNSRGAMEIVLGILALRFGLIQETVFVALVIMALVTSISSAPLMSIFLRRINFRISFTGLLSPKLIIDSSATDKYEAINELCLLVSEQIKIPPKKIYDAIIKREKEMPSGSQNYLALPHAKMKIEKPVVAISINQKGVDFGCIDNLPAKIILMLLVPQNENELQLKLLSEIAKEFKSAEKVEQLLSTNSHREFVTLLKNITN